MRLFSPTLGSYLVALVMLAVIPLMVIAGVLTWRQSVLQRSLFDKSLVQTAQALSVALDRHLYADVVMLQTLASSPLLDEADFRAFHALCSRVIQEREGVLTVLFAQGQHPDAELRERLRGLDWKVPFAYDVLAEGYARSLLPEGTSLPTVLLQTAEGRALFLGAWNAGTLAELRAALDGEDAS